MSETITLGKAISKPCALFMIPGHKYVLTIAKAEGNYEYDTFMYLIIKEDAYGDVDEMLHEDLRRILIEDNGSVRNLTQEEINAIDEILKK
jgi:hypothetical protein